MSDVAQMKQLSIFDVLFEKAINPLHEVAKYAEPMWKGSRQKLIDYCNTDPDIKEWTAAVKKQYSPYGCNGAWNIGDHKANELHGYDLTGRCVEVTYYDAQGIRTDAEYSWADFAREIADLIWSHNYRGE